jgi:hypothetical protein
MVKPLLGLVSVSEKASFHPHKKINKPFYKKGKKSSSKDSHPSSFKDTVKVIANRLISFLEKHNILINLSSI